jgi:LEA14-like dessication related protein
MRRTLGALALAALVSGSLPGCVIWQAYLQRTAIKEAQLSLRSVQLEGLDMLGITLLATLELANPTAGDLTLDQLDWTLLVNDVRAARGSTPVTLTVPAGGSRSLPLRVTLAYGDLSSQGRQLVLARGVRTWRLTGTAHFQTPFGRFDYPIHLESPSPASSGASSNR